MTEIIVLEGQDGLGKTTTAKALVDQLTGYGKRVLLAREPGFTSVGEQLRNDFLLSHIELTKESVFYLFQVARLEMLQNMIENHNDKDYIVLDRFWPSTWAYQVCGDGVSKSLYAKAFGVSNYYRKQIGPERVFLLTLGEAERQFRIKQSGKGGDRLESKPADFTQRVSDAYRKMETNPNFTVVSARESVQRVAAYIVEKII